MRGRYRKDVRPRPSTDRNFHPECTFIRYGCELTDGRRARSAFQPARLCGIDKARRTLSVEYPPDWQVPTRQNLVRTQTWACRHGLTTDTWVPRTQKGLKRDCVDVRQPLDVFGSPTRARYPGTCGLTDYRGIARIQILTSDSLPQLAQIAARFRPERADGRDPCGTGMPPADRPHAGASLPLLLRTAIDPDPPARVLLCGR